MLQLPAEEDFSELHPVAALVQWLSEVTDPINAAPYWSARGGLWEGQRSRHMMHVHRTAELVDLGGLPVVE